MLSVALYLALATFSQLRLAPYIITTTDQIWGSGSSLTPFTHPSLQNLPEVLEHHHPAGQLPQEREDTLVWGPQDPLGLTVGR